MLKLQWIIFYLVAAISFSQDVYSINEDIGLIQPVLVLSKLLLTDITVQLSSIDINATGNCLYMYFSYQSIDNLIL